ncbi:hypothetical protein HN604_01830 [archaeon]|jgi:hypothetical protein|nr:hypothetical protein [archaeon]MBT6182942.1 hypothetical protein [archaeon]MBT6606593.1 hypothetical protein [archaeon]MBT7251780.1 hypothetical protein [archaeon]MBT7660801.1 hypothetical protein [archaeon]
MIVGIFLGVSLAVFLAASLLMLTGASGLVQDNIITGSVIGNTGLRPYLAFIIVISLAVLYFTFGYLKKRMNY